MHNIARIIMRYASGIEVHRCVVHSRPLTKHSVFTRFYSTPGGRERWDLMAAVVLERRPMISQDMTDLERKFLRTLITIEEENSLKSLHEVRAEKESMMKSKVDSDDADTDELVLQTAHDIEDAGQDELAQFSPASRSTESSDTKSLNRKLDNSLLLAVNARIGQSSSWCFPQGCHIAGESLRQTAERVFKEYYGNDLNCQVLGNAPACFYKYKYPKPVKSARSAVGAKVFFYRANYINGKIDQNKSLVNDFGWFSMAELADKLPDKYYRSVGDLLVTS